jgi:hypothetical protein
MINARVRIILFYDFLKLFSLSFIDVAEAFNNLLTRLTLTFIHLTTIKSSAQWWQKFTCYNARLVFLNLGCANEYVSKQ